MLPVNFVIIDELGCLPFRRQHALALSLFVLAIAYAYTYEWG